MDLLSNLSRDFLNDFAARLTPVLEKFIEIAEKDIFHQEIFQTLQTILKSCQKFIDTEYTALIYHQMAPLFFHHKAHLRIFSAESVAPLIKRTFSFSLYNSILTSSIELDITSMKSVAHLLFESFKQINFTFASKVCIMLQTLLDQFYTFTDLEKDRLFPILETLFILIGHYTDKDNLIDLWEVILMNLLAKPDRYLIDLMNVWLGLREGARIKGFFLNNLRYSSVVFDY